MTGRSKSHRRLTVGLPFSWFGGPSAMSAGYRRSQVICCLSAVATPRCCRGHSCAWSDGLCAPGGTRTPDRLLRRQLLYPAELQAPGLQFFPAKVTRWQRCG
jgi:hypothetical protein